MLGNCIALNLFVSLSIWPPLPSARLLLVPWFWPFSQAPFPRSPHHSHGFCYESDTHAFKLLPSFLLFHMCKKCRLKQSRTKIWKESKTQIVKLRYLEPKFIIFEIDTIECLLYPSYVKLFVYKQSSFISKRWILQMQGSWVKNFYIHTAAMKYTWG